MTEPEGECYPTETDSLCLSHIGNAGGQTWNPTPNITLIGQRSFREGAASACSVVGFHHNSSSVQEVISNLEWPSVQVYNTAEKLLESLCRYKMLYS